MLNKYIFTFLLFISVCVAGGYSQNTKANGRALFNEGRYEEAKPIFKNLLKRTPKSAEYNYWYAACCYETNDTVAGIEDMLKLAASRRVLNAYYYLARLYKDALRYPEAMECYEEYLDIGKDEEKLAAAEEQLAKVKELFRMMKSTEQVCFIDSFVVDKTKFLQAYNAGKDIGRLSAIDAFFDNKSFDGQTVFVTERGTDIFFSDSVSVDSVKLLKMFSASKNGTEWSSPLPLKGFDTGGNDDYPFMSADGATFYFASDGNGSIGGYDIFVTRYDSESRRFLKPTNVGMPFNSEADDYMMVINEIANLGWFATNRRMPEGKVCVYVFIPNSVRATYDYEKLGYDKMLGLSQLTSVADTQHDDGAVRKARQQLTMLRYEREDNGNNADFCFVIDDVTTYTSLSDFKNSAAKGLFTKWQKRVKQLKTDSVQLENRRLQYNNANNALKQRLVGEILSHERKCENEAETLKAMEKEIRKLEYEYINR